MWYDYIDRGVALCSTHRSEEDERGNQNIDKTVSTMLFRVVAD